MASRRSLISTVPLSLLLVAGAAPATASPAPAPAAAPTTATPTTATTTPATAPAAATTAAATTTAAAATGLRFLDVPVGDGVVLKANLIAPTAAGPHPALVFISSWGINDAEYIGQAKILAAAGYVVLSYTARGFWGSGGRVETAGPLDVADARRVIDWLLANTAADPTRLGVGGVSYGAGIGLLAAAHDPRIRAVAAMSGWTDLVESLYGHQTRRPQAVWLLKLAAEVFGRPSAEFDRITDDYFADRNVPQLVEWGRRRSATTYLDRLNANAPAILLANAYGDSVFGPNQLVDFFTRFTGPKRLEYAPGDHAIPEITGLAGLPNHVWDSTRRWFDEHLRGAGAGPSTAVVLRVRNASGAVETYADWADVKGSSVRYHLGATRWWDGTGPLARDTDAPDAAWSETVTAIGDTVAGAGVVLLSGGLEALTGEPATAWLPAVSRIRGAVWTSEPVARGAQIRGIPRVHLAVRSSAATGTIMAYLYDVNGVGTGRLISHTPVTWPGGGPNASTDIDVALPATAWNLPAGHRLALVLDTADPLYFDRNPFGARITISAPSWLEVPLR